LSDKWFSTKRRGTIKAKCYQTFLAIYPFSYLASVFGSGKHFLSSLIIEAEGFVVKARSLKSNPRTLMVLRAFSVRLGALSIKIEGCRLRLGAFRM
jgi:hypothetical protein